MGKLQTIQALRFFAALAVVYAHSVDVLDHLKLPYGALVPRGFSNAGAMGVDLFFVISGFVITTVARRPVTEFFGKRLRRIVPLYWLLSAPWVIIWIVRGDWQWSRLLTTLMFIPIGAGDPLLDVGWTLGLEMLFYGATAVVLLNDRRMITAVLLTALSFGCAFLPGQLTHFAGHPMFVEFLMGVGIAKLWRRSRPSKPVGIALLVAGLAMLLVVAPMLDPLVGRASFFARTIFAGPAMAAIVFGALQFEPVKLRALSYLGDSSFSIYLAQHLALLAWEAQAPRFVQSPDAILLGGMLVAVAAGLIAFELLEKPILSAFRSTPRLSLQAG